MFVGSLDGINSFVLHFLFHLLQDVDQVTDEDLNPTRDKFPTLKSERKTLRNPEWVVVFNGVEATMLDRQDNSLER